ncbi:helix-turn-helix transcriptional regulator [Terrimonas sp. NA20]|uniref:Helix-turn-helix transcriptional regulator n=1 Tax=Terrimonas ginsenosidimutans TaxID=2908004 RepID=A0ABS9L0U6_9BACT|nr:helix-turn-helix transcriptional regulator [Terrimonas ginsenosidimutans]MCG2618196.1 helix-turn-helix transcriptional regulator [Terrimonas ginsenosidimutans]
MTFGEHITTLRKRKSLSQADLGKLVGTSGDIIGKYERDEVKPSIEVASKIADALEVSLDYLVGKTSVEIGSRTLNRLQDIQKLNEHDKATVLEILDAFLRDRKAKKAYTI